MIPVVIVHFGNEEYFQKVIEITSKKNTIFLIGDETNTNIPNARHIDYKELMTDEINLAKSFFDFKANKPIQVLEDLTCVDYGKYEFLSLARIYFLRELMKRENISWVFHLDGDCILFENVNNIDFLKQEIVTVSKPFQTRELDMVTSIHNSLLNVEFCEKLIESINTVYINKTLAHKFIVKIIWHATNEIQGNICDKTFYSMLCEKNLIRTKNAISIFHHKLDLCTFDHCIEMPVGATKSNMYVMENGIKKLEKDGEKIIATTTNGAKIRMLSLHFNAHTKHLINNFK